VREWTSQVLQMVPKINVRFANRKAPAFAALQASRFALGHHQGRLIFHQFNFQTENLLTPDRHGVKYSLFIKVEADGLGPVFQC
jgi:hypothetical protein